MLALVNRMAMWVNRMNRIGVHMKPMKKPGEGG